MGSGLANNVTHATTLSVICDADGTVVFQTPLAIPRASTDATSAARVELEPDAEPPPTGSTDAWRSDGENGSIATAVGRPLVKTYWLDHLDCDVREIQQIVRRAAHGKADRVRVWLRVNEQQLVRADLTATPLLDASGAARHVLVRTEPTHAGPLRRREGDAGEPITKPYRRADGHDAGDTVAAVDLLTMALPVPLLRVELPGGTVLGANDAVASLIGRTPDQLRGLPLSELIDPRDRRSLGEALASTAAPARDLDVQLAGGPAARLTLLADPFPSAARGTAAALLVFVRDATPDQQLTALKSRADALALAAAANEQRLARLDRLIDRAPVGLALYEGDQVVRSNAAFDASHRSSAAWIDPLAAEASRTRGVATAGDDVHVAQSFPIDDAEPDLVGAMIAALPAETLRLRSQVASLARALGGSRRAAAFTIATDDALLPLEPGGLAAGNVESIFDAATVRPFRAALARARSAEEPVSIDVSLRDGGARHAVLVADATRSVQMLLFDEVDRAAEREGLQHRIDELGDVVEALRQASVDPRQFEQVRREATERHERLTQLVDAVDAGTFSWDVEAGLVDADARCLSLLALDGPTREDAPVTPVTLLAASSIDDRARFERALFDAMSPEGDGRLDLQIAAGPESRPVRIVGTVAFESRDASRDPARFFAVVLDLAADRAAQTRVADLEGVLRVRAAELDAIFEATPDALRLTRDGVVRHNAAAAAQLGGRAETFDDAATSPAARALAGEAGVAELRLAAGDAERVVLSSAAPVIVEGRVVGAVAIERDVTELRDLEAKLRERDQELSGIFGNTGVGIAYLDGEGTILDVNPQLSVLLGRARADLVGRTMADLTVAEDRATLQGQVDAVRSGELTSCSAELRLVRRGDEPTWAQLTVAPRHGDRERSVIALIQDVNELRLERGRAAELAATLATLRHRNELFASAGSEGFIVLDASLRFIEGNDAARRLLRLPADAAGSPFDHVAIAAADGSPLSSSKLPWNRALRGKPNRAELRVTFADATTLVVECEATAVAQAGERSSQRLLSLVLRDVTARQALQDELQKAYARIVEAHTILQQRTQHLESNFVSAVQQLGAAAASATPAARTLSVEARLPSELRPSAQQLVDALRVHGRLVQHYTDSAIGQSSTPRAVHGDVDVHLLVAEALRLVSARFNVGGRLTTKLAATATAVRVDGAIVRHALWSLFAHAASQASRSPALIESDDLAPAEGDAAVRVQVSWPGKSSHTAEVALARQFIEAEGGTFEVATADGTTRATVMLALTAPSDAPRGAAPTPPPQLRVLLIEDHDSTARVLTRQLIRLQCDVTPAATLAAADAALLGATAFDLIVCDLGLPDGSAIDFVRRVVRRSSKPLPAIALRGYGGIEQSASVMRSAGFVAQLTKPVDLNALAAAIGRLERLA